MASFKKNRRYQRPFKNSNNGSKYKDYEQLTEAEVGITQYVSKEIVGFSAIIKARYSDFHVNEIDLNGEVAKLTDTIIPKIYDKTKSTNVDDESDETLKAKRVDKIPEDVWIDIISLIKTTTDDENREVPLDVTDFTKEERTTVHEGVKKVFNQKIVAKTVQENNKKIILFKKYNKLDKVNERNKWPADIPEYVHFLVYKEWVDTLEASLKISSCLKMNASNFTYAGTKDKRAKTTQWFSAKKVEPWKLIIRTKNIKNIKIGNIKFKEAPLKLGQLQGNYFRVALRNVEASEDDITVAMESLKQNGFINYYGLQRFGKDKDVPTYSIGIKLLQGAWKEACDLILKPKQSDNDGSDLYKAKLLYQKTGDAKQAANCLNKHVDNSIESKLLLGLAKGHNNDYVNALESVPRNMRLLYLHSFQSLVWNRVVSRRLEKYGLQVLEGDIVVTGKEKLDENNEKDLVLLLNSENLSKYKIQDIVLPLPGYDVTYPENEIKDWYQEILKEYNLDLEMAKQKVRTYNLSGDYRKILSNVQDLTWSVVKYNDPNDTLILSDFEELKGQELPKPVEDGKYKALLMSFSLDSSCYATMVFREILKMDTSTSTHARMNNYHLPEKEKSSNNHGESVTGIESLLNNSDKYELFKKSIFNPNDDKTRSESPSSSLSPEKRKISMEEDDAEAKKIKLEESAIA